MLVIEALKIAARYAMTVNCQRMRWCPYWGGGLIPLHCLLPVGLCQWPGVVFWFLRSGLLFLTAFFFLA